jgi:hypothetical protein
MHYTIPFKNRTQQGTTNEHGLWPVLGEDADSYNTVNSQILEFIQLMPDMLQLLLVTFGLNDGRLNI